MAEQKPKRPATAEDDAPPTSFEDIWEQKERATITVGVPLNSELARDYREAEVAEEEARRWVETFPTDPARLRTLEDAQERLEEARVALEPKLARFTFAAMGAAEFDELLNDNPPTKDQREKWRKKNPQAAAMGGGARFNEDVFPIKLLAACAIEPSMTEAQAKQLYTGERFNQAERDALFAAAWDVNNQRRVVDLGKGSRPTES
jgi:hypothetical protein